MIYSKRLKICLTVWAVEKDCCISNSVMSWSVGTSPSLSYVLSWSSIKSDQSSGKGKVGSNQSLLANQLGSLRGLHGIDSWKAPKNRVLDCLEIVEGVPGSWLSEESRCFLPSEDTA